MPIQETETEPESQSQPTEAPKKKRVQKKHKRFAMFFFLAHLLGVFTSFHALMGTRTPQGSIAWIVSLNTVPIISVPAYWVFGRDRFHGYITLRQMIESSHAPEETELKNNVFPYVQQSEHSSLRAAEKLSKLPFFNSNAVKLLINGQQTFSSIFEGIDQAKDYILVQFYIVRDDTIGRQLKEKLIKKAKSGVKIYFLYDEIGTRGIDNYLAELTDAGIQVSSFHSTRGGGNRFQLNFRNHRKIVVVDGKMGWVGGLNVGDEYLGNDPKFPNWRDTHMKLTGPSVLQLQLSFVEDWHWAKDEDIELNWIPTPAPSANASVLILPTGPADRLESCSLMYQQAIHTAQKRIWIASPYFVPDSAVMDALHLAALRGVEVKILIPDEPDSKLVYYSAFAFIGDLIDSGIEIYRYKPGFLHEKVFLVDDAMAGVGTANFDNRSFRLNFEVTALVLDSDFVKDVEVMFEDDFKNSRLMSKESLESKPYWFKILSRASYLTAPIQ